DEQETEVVILYTQHSAAEYEQWLREHEQLLPNGTILITGLASFVHYGAHIDGFRLAWFSQPLSPNWKLVREYEGLSYLPRREPARLWRLEHREATRVVPRDEREDVSSLQGMDDPAALFAAGMARYDKGDHPAARIYFRKLLATRTPQADDAAF